jgi:hypothetical protein
LGKKTKKEIEQQRQHNKMMKKYRKIFKEQGCMHWPDSSG